MPPMRFILTRRQAGGQADCVVCLPLFASFGEGKPLLGNLRGCGPTYYADTSNPFETLWLNILRTKRTPQEKGFLFLHI